MANFQIYIASERVGDCCLTPTQQFSAMPVSWREQVNCQ